MKKGPSTGKVLDDSMLSDVFGIEMDEMVVAPKKAAPEKRKAPAKQTATKELKKATASGARLSKKRVVAPKVASVKAIGIAKETASKAEIKPMKKATAVKKADSKPATKSAPLPTARVKSAKETPEQNIEKSTRRSNRKPR
jgi:hypothetical protein